MMVRTEILASPLARRTRPADPRQAAETAETLKTVKRVKMLKTVNALSHTPAAPTPETLKQDTPPASRSRAETVKRVPGCPCGISPRTARETLKQRPKTQAGEDVTCFTPILPADPPETAPRRNRTARETLKHSGSPRRARETAKTLKTARTVRAGTRRRAGRVLAPGVAARLGPGDLNAPIAPIHDATALVTDCACPPEVMPAIATAHIARPRFRG